MELSHAVYRSVSTVMSVSDISVRRHYGDDNDNDDERFGRNSPVVVEI